MTDSLVSGCSVVVKFFESLGRWEIHSARLWVASVCSVCVVSVLRIVLVPVVQSIVVRSNVEYLGR